MKKVTPYGNHDNLHCLQSCVRSVVEYLLPHKKFTKNYIDKNTCFNGYLSWLPPAVIWLNKIGLETKLYSPFDYLALSERGENYLKEFKKDAYFLEKSTGSYIGLGQIQVSSKEMCERGYWVNKIFSINDLSTFLKGKNNLAIGKTIYEWLDGNYISRTQHYVLLLEQNEDDNFIVHDPGKPMRAFRKISTTINGHSMFGDIVTITKK